MPTPKVPQGMIRKMWGGGIKYGMSPLVEKVGGGGDMSPPFPHQIAPMVLGNVASMVFTWGLAELTTAKSM